MKEITATILARQLREVLDAVQFKGEEVVVVRNTQPIARILPTPGQMNALEVLSDLFRTLPANVARGWINQSRKKKESLSILRNPWGS